ncbi:MAG: DUF4838 domain-containing protein, partial [Thermoguttaceae bacterium]|nr:DUF4838 domain-containing protein [Thermoguttaceae bacterium]
MKQQIMKRRRSISLTGMMIMVGFLSARNAAADAWIVEKGTPLAQIVVATESPRLTRLAAEELRDYVQKMTGAELPIRNEAFSDYPITVFVGHSEGTDDRGISVDGCTHGAYRMLSGRNWLALIGHDEDFEPVEPWARNHGDRVRAQAEWEKLTGGTWNNPMNRLFRDHHQSSGIWTHDEGGSLQAVYAFLRDLGVRWFMPGELGEVVPRLESIPLPSVDKAVKPDFPYRDLRLGNVPHFPWEDFVWHLRLGLNDQGLVGSHGMIAVHGSSEMRSVHPEYYALLASTRDTTTRGTGHACFSSDGLLQETIAYARARFDRFDLPAVSIFPQDGYRHCHCEKCADRSPSEVVWEFVEKVARAVYETHPDRLVLGGAYTSYSEPPDTIERFSPNVAVRISSMRPGLDDDERWAAYWNLVETWAARLAPQRLMRNANIQWTASRGFPILHPRSIAREFAAMRGISLGESSSVPRHPDQRWQTPGISHLNIYVLSRFLWDAQTDLDVLLEDYYHRFYGPAASAMREAFDYAESIYPRDGRPTPGRIDYAQRVRFVEMLHAAREKAGNTIYGRRIDAVIGDLLPLDELRSRHALAEARGEVREFWTLMPFDEERRRAAAESFVLDGKLDEPFWTVYLPGGTLRLSDTGERPEFGTRFQMRWYGDHLYIGIHCEEASGSPLNVTTTDNGDPAIFEGDSVTVLLETHDHAYYEITVHPAGAVWDVDHSEDGVKDRWTSNAEVATHVGDNFWSAEMRIPVVAQDDDPLHWVNGRTPSHTFPWYFNIARR